MSGLENKIGYLTEFGELLMNETALVNGYDDNGVWTRVSDIQMYLNHLAISIWNDGHDVHKRDVTPEIVQYIVDRFGPATAGYRLVKLQEDPTRQGWMSGENDYEFQVLYSDRETPALILKLTYGGAA